MRPDLSFSRRGVFLRPVLPFSKWNVFLRAVLPFSNREVFLRLVLSFSKWGVFWRPVLPLSVSSGSLPHKKAPVSLHASPQGFYAAGRIIARTVPGTGRHIVGDAEILNEDLYRIPARKCLRSREHSATILSKRKNRKHTQNARIITSLSRLRQEMGALPEKRAAKI